MLAASSGASLWPPAAPPAVHSIPRIGEAVHYKQREPRMSANDRTLSVLSACLKAQALSRHCGPTEICVKQAAPCLRGSTG